MRRITALFVRVSEEGLRLSVIAFVVLALLQIVTRYVLDAPLQWTEEVAVIVLTWMTYAGAWVLFRSDTHVRLSIVDEFLPPRVVKVVHLVWAVLMLIVSVIVVYAGIRIMPMLSYDRTPALQLPYARIFAIIPVAFAVIALMCVGRIVGTLRAFR